MILGSSVWCSKFYLPCMRGHRCLHAGGTCTCRDRGGAVSLGPGPMETLLDGMSSSESWPAYLVSSRLISQLDQGRTDTVKSITTQFGHWWFIRYKQIYCHYTSNSCHIIGKNYSFYSLRSRNSHFHYINSAKYHIFHIYTIYKFFKNSRKQHISYLLKNHYFWHFSIFLSFWQICHFHHFPQFIKNHHFSPFLWDYQKSPFLQKCQFYWKC